MADFNKSIYGNLVVEAQPAVIRSEPEFDRVMMIVRQLQSESAEERSPEKARLYDLLTLLVTE